MLNISSLLRKYEIKKAEPQFKNWRDELVTNFTDSLNRERIIKGFKPLTKKAVALLLNRNPILAKNDGEVDLLYRDCLKRGNFKKFWWVTNPRNK